VIGGGRLSGIPYRKAGGKWYTKKLILQEGSIISRRRRKNFLKYTIPQESYCGNEGREKALKFLEKGSYTGGRRRRGSFH